MNANSSVWTERRCVLLLEQLGVKCVLTVEAVELRRFFFFIIIQSWSRVTWKGLKWKHKKQLRCQLKYSHWKQKSSVKVQREKHVVKMRMKSEEMKAVKLSGGAVIQSLSCLSSEQGDWTVTGSSFGNCYQTGLGMWSHSDPIVTNHNNFCLSLFLFICIHLSVIYFSLNGSFLVRTWFYIQLKKDEVPSAEWC